MSVVCIDSLIEARQILKEGKILVYPTEAVYGIGCDALNEQAVLRLLALKKRSQEKGLIILIHDWAQLSPWIKEISPEAMQKVKDTWPGPVTWLFPKSEFVPDWISGDSPFVAIRMTAHPIARELCLDFPIVSTSANLTADSPAKTLTNAIKLCTILADGLVNGKLGEATQPSQIIEVETGIKRR